METVTFVAGQAVETVVERLFARKIVQVIGDARRRAATTITSDLLEPDYQLDLFRWREGHITASVAQRFRRGLDDGYDAVRGLPRRPGPRRRRRPGAHGHGPARGPRRPRSTRARTRRCAGAEAGSATCTRCTSSSPTKGFFQEHGRLTGPRCKAITREVNRLCNEVRRQAGALVDAFGIPDAILAAPIALRDPAPGPLEPGAAGG